MNQRLVLDLQDTAENIDKSALTQKKKLLINVDSQLL